MPNSTWNPSDKSAGITLSGGNLVAANNNSTLSSVRTVDKQVSGKFYWEATLTSWGHTNDSIGFGVSSASLTAGLATNASPGTCSLNRGGVVYVDGVSAGFSFGTVTSGTVVCFAIDLSARWVWFRLGAAGNWNNSAPANPATGAGGVAVTVGAGLPAYPMLACQLTGDSVTANFGDTAFTGVVPSGFTAGWPSGATSPTNDIVTQIGLEHWLTTNPDAQVTQMALEHWATTASGNLQAVVTQVALEHWASVANVIPSTGGPMISVIL